MATAIAAAHSSSSTAGSAAARAHPTADMGVRRSMVAAAGGAAGTVGAAAAAGLHRESSMAAGGMSRRHAIGSPDGMTGLTLPRRAGTVAGGMVAGTAGSLPWTRSLNTGTCCLGKVGLSMRTDALIVGTGLQRVASITTPRSSRRRRLRRPVCGRHSLQSGSQSGMQAHAGAARRPMAQPSHLCLRLQQSLAKQPSRQQPTGRLQPGLLPNQRRHRRRRSKRSSRSLRTLCMSGRTRQCRQRQLSPVLLHGQYRRRQRRNPQCSSSSPRLRPSARQCRKSSTRPAGATSGLQQQGRQLAMARRGSSVRRSRLRHPHPLPPPSRSPQQRRLQRAAWCSRACHGRPWWQACLIARWRRLLISLLG